MSCIIQNKFVDQDAESAFLNDDSADVHFVSDAITIPVHKSILSDVSPVFKQTFFGPLKQDGNIELCFSPAAFTEFLQLFYLPKMTFTMENCEEVAAVIDYYDLSARLAGCLKDNCDESLHDFSWGFQIAIILDHQELKEFYGKKIIFNPVEIFHTDTFLHCQKMLLENILQMDFLACTEIDVLNACLEWSKLVCRKNGLDAQNGKKLRAEWGDLFKLIRFRAIGIRDIHELNARYKGLLTNEEMKAIQENMYHENISANVQQRSTPPFDQDKAVPCWKVQGYQASSYYTENIESMWFSTNRALSLGKIQFQDVMTMSQSLIFEIKVSIIEYVEQSFEPNVEQVCLYEGQMSISRNTNLTLNLSHKPILILCGKMYEVRVENLRKQNAWHFATMNTSHVELNENVLVKFHDTADSRRGLVALLVFNIL